jgi:hypothetical protein
LTPADGTAPTPAIVLVLGENTVQRRLIGDGMPTATVSGHQYRLAFGLAGLEGFLHYFLVTIHAYDGHLEIEPEPRLKQA